MANISYKDIAKVVTDKLESTPTSEIAESLAGYLVEQRRVGDLDRIMREVLRLRGENGILEVTTQSRHELSDPVKSQIQRLFDSDSIVLNEVINKDLVGGVKIQALDTEIDLSVRGQLNQLRSHKF